MFEHGTAANRGAYEREPDVVVLAGMHVAATILKGMPKERACQEYSEGPQRDGGGVGH